MKPFYFEIATPVHPKWNAWLDEEHYIKLGNALTHIAGDFYDSHLLDIDKGIETLPFQCTIKFSDDRDVQNLNRDFRDKDKPTNVLSFPDGDEDIRDDGTAVYYIGDIILAYETVNKEASDQNKSFTEHLFHLCVHGILHLLGHDHIVEDEAEIMESLEIKLLEKCGFKNPYEV